jgi:hypothetical protein
VATGVEDDEALRLTDFRLGGIVFRFSEVSLSSQDGRSMRGYTV